MVLFSPDAAAPPHPNRITVAANLAVGSFWGNESHLGWGPLLGFSVRFQPWTRWGFEFDTRRFTHKRRFATSGVVFAGEGVELTGGVTCYLRTSGARPFISGGVGILRWERESRFPINAPLSAFGITPGAPPINWTEVFHSRGTNADLSVGGGVDIPLTADWYHSTGGGELVGRRQRSLTAVTRNQRRGRLVVSHGLGFLFNVMVCPVSEHVGRIVLDDSVEFGRRARRQLPIGSRVYPTILVVYRICLILAGRSERHHGHMSPAFIGRAAAAAWFRSL